MTRARVGIVAVAGLRLAYAAGLAFATERVTRPWIGSVPRNANVGVRGLAAREAALHVGQIAAAVAGTPVRPWLAGAIAGDVADVASTFAAGDSVPSGAALKTLAVAGGSAALAGALLALVDS